MKCVIMSIYKSHFWDLKITGTYIVQYIFKQEIRHRISELKKQLNYYKGWMQKGYIYLFIE